jgi:succinate-acetate transporter protein
VQQIPQTSVVDEPVDKLPDRFYRPNLADPTPLGLGAFALTTFVLSMYNAEILPPAGKPIVLGLALAYGGLVQVLAGMWEFRTGNTFGAVAFSSFGGFWLSFFVFEQFIAKDVPQTAAGSALGLYLVGWAIFTSYMFIASLRTTAVVSLMFLVLAATFSVLGIGEWVANGELVRVGGYLGLGTAGLAWYASFAAVTNATFGKVVFPVVDLRR